MRVAFMVLPHVHMVQLRRCSARQHVLADVAQLVKVLCPALCSLHGTLPQHLPPGAAASLTGRSLAQCRPRLLTTTAAAAQGGGAQQGVGQGWQQRGWSTGRCRCTAQRHCAPAAVQGQHHMLVASKISAGGAVMADAPVCSWCTCPAGCILSGACRHQVQSTQHQGRSCRLSQSTLSAAKGSISSSAWM